MVYQEAPCMHQHCSVDNCNLTPESCERYTVIGLHWPTKEREDDKTNHVFRFHKVESRPFWCLENIHFCLFS